MEQNFENFFIVCSFVCVLIMMIFGLISIIGTRHYKLDSAYLRIKSSRKILSGQDVVSFLGCLFICGSVCIAIVVNGQLAPVTVIGFLIMFFSLLTACLFTIYTIISNIISSRKVDFVKEIILDQKLKNIQIYYNRIKKIVPFKDISSFSIYSCTANVPNIKPINVKTGGVVGALISSMETNQILTDITIIISTVNNETIIIHTMGNALFDYSSEELLKALKQYKTIFKNFSIE